jgi:ribosomal protein S18 acetylase RimI-like enzyme
MTGLKIIQVESEEHQQHVRELFRENFSSTRLLIIRDFGIDLNVSTVLEQEMAQLQQFAPPEGRLLLSDYDGQIAGCAGLRKIGKDVGEIKRMYVRPDYRRRGIGRSLVKAILNESYPIGYSTLRLDSAPFAQEAHALYQSLGFQLREPYAESEIPQQYHSQWVFMEMTLSPVSFKEGFQAERE